MLHEPQPTAVHVALVTQGTVEQTTGPESTPLSTTPLSVDASPPSVVPPSFVAPSVDASVPPSCGPTEPLLDELAPPLELLAPLDASGTGLTRGVA